jgi:hypothetical protein
LLPNEERKLNKNLLAELLFLTEATGSLVNTLSCLTGSTLFVLTILLFETFCVG